MRTLETAVETAIAEPVTTPGYIGEILFPSPTQPFRFATKGATNWYRPKVGGGTELNVFPSRDVAVRNIVPDFSGGSGSIDVADGDNGLSATILNHGVADMTINIWEVYSTAPGTDDPVQLFGGVGDEATFDPYSGRVTITLALANSSTTFCPRLRITPANGFNHLPAAGTLFTWNGEVYELQGEG